MTNGIPGSIMPAWGSDGLSTSDIANVVSYLLTPVTGAQLYTANCAVCHGADRQGGLGPTLIPIPGDADFLTQVITSGIQGSIMPPWGTVNCDTTCPITEHSLAPYQIQQIVSYLMTPVTGYQMYTANCATCHGKNGQGGVGPRLNPAPGDANFLTQVITNGVSGTIMPVWGSNGVSWTDDQIAQMVNFLLNWPAPPAPTPPPVAQPTPPPTLPGDPTAGAQVYSANCASCHGASGQGGVGPQLNPAPGDVSFLTQVITNGRGSVMPAWGTMLTSGQIRDVVSFLLTWPNGGVPSASPTPAPQPAPAPGATGTTQAAGGDQGDGAQVFAANCAVCHGASRQGGVGPKLDPAPGDAAYLTQVITSGRNKMPAWGRVLSAKQIDDVVQFLLASGRPAASPTPSTQPSSAGTSPAPAVTVEPTPVTPTTVKQAGIGSGLDFDLLVVLLVALAVSLGGNLVWGLSRYGRRQGRT